MKELLFHGIIKCGVVSLLVAAAMNACYVGSKAGRLLCYPLLSCTNDMLPFARESKG